MKKKTLLRSVTEGAVMLALATVLSLIKIVDLPYGGSITIASMLPVMIIAYRYGVKWGLITGTAYGVIQQLLGLKTLSYFTSWQSIIAVILLDYVIAFMVIGLGGAFRKAKAQPAGLVLGGLLVCLVRYACHVISGATVWAGTSIPTKAALIYSFSYNATYMVPETIILLVVAYYIGSKLDFRGGEITAYKGAGTVLPNIYQWIAGLLLSGAFIYDIAAVFGKLQNADTGEFDITGLSAVNWKLAAIITGIAVLAAVVFFIIGWNCSKKKKEEANTPDKLD